MGQSEFYLDKMLELEEQGKGEDAVVLGEKVLEVFPEERERILFELGKLKFRMRKDKEALLDFVDAYGISCNQEIYELILEAYLSPNQENCLELYEHNLELLKEYPYYENVYPEEEPRFFPIWQDEELLICVDCQEKNFARDTRREMEAPLQADERYLIQNEMWQETILLCEKSCRISEPFMDANIPMFLVYDRIFWILFLQLYDLQELMKRKRIVFLVGVQSVEEYFGREERILPTCLGRGTTKEYVQMLSWIARKQMAECDLYNKMVEDYYHKNKWQIIENMKSGKPRILFWTSRFTTVLQYHTRDCMQAAERLGCETELLIERNSLDRIPVFYIKKVLARLKPDIIFCIDHFRFEHREYVPEEIVWITWIQDPMPEVINPGTPSKLNKRDFVMNHMITSKKFQKIGYGKYHMIDAPVPANSHVYKPYKLTRAEREEYECDICFVCHASDVDNYILEQVKMCPEGIREEIMSIYKGYQQYVYETGEFFYSREMFALYIEGAFLQHYRKRINENLLVHMAKDMHLWFNQRVYRQVLADWILDAGFTNIKLWGNGWMDNEKYGAYAMGPAENGEVLSKIYQASKVVIGNNITSTGAARAWESMLSGAFYMSNYIPPEADITDIRQIIEINKDVVMFYNKEDLIKKLHYYLEHEQERQKMIERGRKVALEKMTFDRLMKKVLDTVAERLEGE